MATQLASRVSASALELPGSAVYTSIVRPVSAASWRVSYISSRRPTTGWLMSLVPVRCRWTLCAAHRVRKSSPVLPTGAFAGLPEDALDYADGLYLSDPKLGPTADELTNLTT